MFGAYIQYPGMRGQANRLLLLDSWRPVSSIDDCELDELATLIFIIVGTEQDLDTVHSVGQLLGAALM